MSPKTSPRVEQILTTAALTPRYNKIRLAFSKCGAPSNSRPQRGSPSDEFPATRNCNDR
jgi:hypothetical protein